MENIGLVGVLVSFLAGTCWFIYATIKHCLKDND